MNNLQQFMPGLGQEITPEALIGGLQMFKRQGPTVGNPGQQDDGGRFAQALESYRDSMASAPDAQYQEGSGGLGALGMIAQAVGREKAKQMGAK